MTSLPRIFPRLILSLLAALALGSAIQAASASAAAPFPMPSSLPYSRTMENVGSYNYTVTVPCRMNKRFTGSEYHWNVCDYALTATSRTARIAPLTQGGDLYSPRPVARGTGITGPVTAFIPFKIADDNIAEFEKYVHTELTLTVRDCVSSMFSPSRANCSRRIGTYVIWGSMFIDDNEE